MSCPTFPAVPVLAAALLAGGLAGCTDTTNQFPPACPALAFLSDGADLTRFAPSGHDVTDVVLQARLTAVPAKCETVSESKVKATLHVKGEVTRGPAAKSREADLTYFVAVEDGGRISEQDFPVHVEFPANSDHVSLADEPVELVLPVSTQKSAAAYKIYVAFRLSPAELAYNRQQRGH
jgi:hypothetical protein